MRTLGLLACLLLIALSFRFGAERLDRGAADAGASAPAVLESGGLESPRVELLSTASFLREPEEGSRRAAEPPASVVSTPTELPLALVNARGLALDYHARDRAFFGRAFCGGWSLPLQGDELRRSFALPADLDLDSLAVLVEADTVAHSNQLAALCDQYLLAFDEAVWLAVEGGTPEASREPIPGGRKERDDFHRVRVESDGWHFVFRVRLGENPELARLWAEGQRRVAARRRAVQTSLNEILGQRVARATGTQFTQPEEPRPR